MFLDQPKKQDNFKLSKRQQFHKDIRIKHIQSQFKSSRIINNLLLYNQKLSNPQLKQNNQLFQQAIQKQNYQQITYKIAQQYDPDFIRLVQININQIILRLIKNKVNNHKVIVLMQSILDLQEQFIFKFYQYQIPSQIAQQFVSLNNKKQALQIYGNILILLTKQPQTVEKKQIKQIAQSVIQYFFICQEQSSTLTLLLFNLIKCHLFSNKNTKIQQLLQLFCQKFQQYKKKNNKINIYLSAQEILLLSQEYINQQLYENLLKLFIEGNKQVPTIATNRFEDTILYIISKGQNTLSKSFFTKYGFLFEKLSRNINLLKIIKCLIQKNQLQKIWDNLVQLNIIEEIIIFQLDNPDLQVRRTCLQCLDYLLKQSQDRNLHNELIQILIDLQFDKTLEQFYMVQKNIKNKSLAQQLLDFFEEQKNKKYR